jgi:hypothetical protein
MKIYKTREELLISLGKDLVIAEIGVFKGDFSKFIFENMQPKKLYLVDVFDGYVGSGDKDGNNMQFTFLEKEYEFLKEHFKKDSNVFIIKDTSSNFLQKLDNESLDIIYIDGDHDYNGVKSDLHLSYDKVKKGGYICGHDYVSPRFEGVVNAVNEFCEYKNLKIKYITNDGCPTYCIEKL